MFHVEQWCIQQPGTWVSSPQLAPARRTVGPTRAFRSPTFIRPSRPCPRGTIERAARPSARPPTRSTRCWQPPGTGESHRGRGFDGYPDAAQLCGSSPVNCTRDSNHVAHRLDRCVRSVQRAVRTPLERLEVPRGTSPTATSNPDRACRTLPGPVLSLLRSTPSALPSCCGLGRRTTGDRAHRSVQPPGTPTGLAPSSRPSGAARTDPHDASPADVRRPTFQQRTGVVSAGRRSRAPPARESHRATSGALRPTGRRRAAR